MVGHLRNGPKPQSEAYLRGAAGNKVVVNIDGTRESDLTIVPLPPMEALLPPNGARAK
jgi:hypothetical protein